jgi:hypothetical protein
VAAGLACGVALIIVLVVARSRRRTGQSGAEADWGLDSASDWDSPRRSGRTWSPRDPEHSLPERGLRDWEQPRRPPRRRPDHGQPDHGQLEQGQPYREQPEWERPEQGRPERRPEPAAANSLSMDISSPDGPPLGGPLLDVPALDPLALDPLARDAPSLDARPMDVPSLDAPPLEYQPRRDPVRHGQYPPGNGYGSQAARIAAERPSPPWDRSVQQDRPVQQDGARHAYLPRWQGAEPRDPQPLPPSPPQPEPVRIRSWFEPSLQPKPATGQPSDSGIPPAPSPGPAANQPPQPSAQPAGRPPPAQPTDRPQPSALPAGRPPPPALPVDRPPPAQSADQPQPSAPRADRAPQPSAQSAERPPPAQPEPPAERSVLPAASSRPPVPANTFLAPGAGMPAGNGTGSQRVEQRDPRSATSTHQEPGYGPPSPLESSRPDSGAQPPPETREHELLDDTRPLPVILADRPAPR